MKRFLALALVLSLGGLTVGCDQNKSKTTDEHKTVQDGKTVKEDKKETETKSDSNGGTKTTTTETHKDATPPADNK